MNLITIEYDWDGARVVAKNTISRAANRFMAGHLRSSTRSRRPVDGRSARVVEAIADDLAESAGQLRTLAHMLEIEAGQLLLIDALGEEDRATWPAAPQRRSERPRAHRVTTPDLLESPPVL